MRALAAGSQQGPFAFLGPDGALADTGREAEVAASSIPHTIVRAGRVREAPGGGSQLRFGALSGGGGGGGGDIRWDFAWAGGSEEASPVAEGCKWCVHLMCSGSVTVL